MLHPPPQSGYGAAERTYTIHIYSMQSVAPQLDVDLPAGPAEDADDTGADLQGIQRRRPRPEVVQDVAALERLMADVLPKLVTYRMANATPDETRVVEYSAPKHLEELLLGAAASSTAGSAMPTQPGSHDDILDGIQIALDYSVRTGHPRFFDKLYAGSDSIGQVRSSISTAQIAAASSLAFSWMPDV